MARTRRQSTLSRSNSNCDSNSDTDVHSRSRSPTPEPPEHIPRPPNSFILYRAHALKKRKEGLEKGTVETITMADFGKLIGPKWKSEPPEVKAYWNMRAAVAKMEHTAKYPDYEYHPNRGPREQKPKRAPCKPTRQASERKVATLGPTERSRKTRSMNEQRDLAAVRTGAQERKARADADRQRGDYRQTRSMTRTSSVGSDVARPEDVQVQNQHTSATARDINHSPAQSLLVEEAPPSPSASLPDWGVLPRSSLLSLLQDPDLDQGLLAHCEQAPEAFDGNIPAPLESDWTHPGHDRPSLWDSDVPLFPRGTFEEEDYSGQYVYETMGAPIPTNQWGSWSPPRQATFLSDFGPDLSQPANDPLLANWPASVQYHLGQNPSEPQGWTAYA